MAKEEKKKKVAADREAEKKAKEEQKAKEAAAKAKAAEDAQAALGAAGSVVATGKVGQELVAELEGKSVTARALAGAALAKQSEAGELTSLSWVADAQYGAALKKLCKGKGSTQKQAGILYACQSAYHAAGFPKTAEKNKDGKKESYLAKLFFDLYHVELIEEEGFNEWRYADDDDEKDPNFVPGKNDALFQLSDFLAWLDEPPEEESGEEDDEDEEDELPPAPVPM